MVSRSARSAGQRGCSSTVMVARAPGDGPRGGPTGFRDLTLIDQIDDEELTSGGIGAK
jgi:hypothetical protein